MSKSIYSGEETEKIKEMLSLSQLKQLEAHVNELSEENAALLEQQKHLRSRYDKITAELKIEQQNLKQANSNSTSNDSALYEEALAQNFRQKEQIEKLTKTIHQREKKIGELQKFEYSYKKNIENRLSFEAKLEQEQKKHIQELHKIQAEKQDVLNEMPVLLEQFAKLKIKIIEEQEAQKILTAEKMQLEVHLLEKTEKFNKLELEIVSLRQQLEAASKKEDAFKLQFEKLESVLQEKYQSSLSDLQKSIQVLEMTLKKHHDLLHEKEQDIENNKNQILQLMQEKLKLEDAVTNLTLCHDEQDARIKVAQQHLGKKVKEVAYLNERIEGQQTHNEELEAMLNQLKAKMTAMQNSFEEQLQQEKKQQENLHEAVRSTKEEAVKWENKYLKSCEKLKVLEEKQQQMQSLFTSINSLMGAPQPPVTTVFVPPVPANNYLSQKNTTHLVDTQNMHHLIVEERSQQEKSALPFTQPSLFDMEQPRLKMRQNLFD